MDSKLLQALQNDVSQEHGYSKNVRLFSDDSNSAGAMSQGSSQEQVPPQPQAQNVQMSKTQAGGGDQSSTVAHTSSPGKSRFPNLAHINPDQFAKQIIAQHSAKQREAQKQKEQQPVMSRLQQQLQGGVTQPNNVTVAVAPVVSPIRKEHAQQSPSKRRVPVILNRPQHMVRPQLQQGIVQQSILMDNTVHPQQMMQTVATMGGVQTVVQAGQTLPQKQTMGFVPQNVRVVTRAQTPLAQGVGRGVSLLPHCSNPVSSSPQFLPRPQKGKKVIPVVTSSIAQMAGGQLQTKAQLPATDTLILVSQPGSSDCKQVIATPQSQSNQVVYTMPRTIAHGQPIFVNKQGQIVNVNTMVKQGMKTVMVSKAQATATKQTITNTVQVVKPGVSIANGTNIQVNNAVNAVRGTVLATPLSPEADGDDDEEDENEQSCPTLLQEQKQTQRLNQQLQADVKGGGKKKKVEAKNIKGNATGLHMVGQGSPVATAGRSWQYSTAGKELTRAPLRPDSAPVALPNQVLNQPAEANENNSNQEKKQVQSKLLEPNQFVVCKWCGNLSKNTVTCDFCHRAFPEDIKYYSAKDEASGCNSDGKNVAMDSKKFYAKSPATPKRTRTSKRKNSEPEMVTISSDENDEEYDSYPSSPVPGPGQTPGRGTPQPSQTLVPQQLGLLPRRQRMEDKKGNVVKKGGRKKTKKEEHPLKKLTPEEHAKALEQVKAMMEEDDEEAMLPDSVSLDARGIRIGSLRGSAYAPVVFSDSGVTLNIECSELSVGELQIPVQDLTRIFVHTSSKMPCIFMQTTPGCTNRIRLKCGMKHKDSNPYYDPMSRDEGQRLISIILNSLQPEEIDKLNCVFEHYEAITPVNHTLVDDIEYNVANVLLAKSSGSIAPHIAIQVPGFIKPQGTIQLHQPLKFITINPNNMTVMMPGNTSDNDMDDEEDDEPKDRSRSPSPPLTVFAGPIVKLFTFPPAPATGGITVTNEDLFCLNEGEFLNDVIIDFYLKYLFINVLEEDDRERTHMFSSFFYRRLTQKARRANEEGETPQQKRHARVKTWTRHVDLFKKDFIIVPINESAHWYLAIICFPWMQKPEVLKVITQEIGLADCCKPSSTNTSDSKDNATTAQPASNSQTPDSNKDSRSEDSKEPDSTKTEDSNEENDSTTSQENHNCTDSQKPDSSQQKAENGNVKSEEEDMEVSLSDTADSTQQADDDNDSSKDVEKTTEATEAKKDSKASQDSNPADSKEDSRPLQEKSSQDSKPLKETKATLEKKGSQPSSGQQSSSQAAAKSLCKNVMRQPCILLFDSLAGPSRSGVVRTLREYLQVEWDVKKAKTDGERTFDKDTIKGASPRCPQQTNYSDCGVYLLQYVESFYEDPVQDYSIPMRALAQWFPEERVRCKREELRDLILSLKNELNPNLEYDCTKDILS